MDDEKKKYTFTDKRGRTDDPGIERTGSGPQSGSDEGAGPHREGSELEIDFSTLIMSFASAAMMSMGNMPDPMTGQVGKNLQIAQQNIGIIQLLKEKTKGNLSREEDALVDSVLYELKMSYIQAQKG